MKKKLNLKHPIIEQAIKFYDTRMHTALDVEQKVENAVLPIYFNIKKNRPEQIGSGVVVNIKNEYFMFSASHVFDIIGQFALLIGLGEGTPLVALTGERFSTAKGKSGTHTDDPLDASVFHIQSNLPEKIKELAITLNDMDLSPEPYSKEAHAIVGFLSKNSNTAGNQAKCKRDIFLSSEYIEETYSQLEVDEKMHIALAYENQVLIGDRWQTSPTPRGISGGAVIRIEGVNLSIFHSSANTKKRQLLTAIIIEQRREKNRKPGALIGTRLFIHLELIRKFLPDLIT